uniref:Pentacotripeptide-repeat region of PRORP domain-containing protein n=1 Tax=Oryza nivara TaxID=4536 RepID=A0A0E0GAE3_ORYNI
MLVYQDLLTASASVQSDCSSDDEKLNCAPSQHARKRSRPLCSDSVVQTLHCLKRRPAIAFAYFKDTQSIGFNHDFSTNSEMIQILSHSRQGKMLVSLFSELVSSSNASGPEILPLVDHHRRTCATPCSLSFMVDCLIKACITCYDVQATICLFSGICRLGVVPSVWTWNLLLKFIAETGEYEMVLAAYNEMKCFQLTPDVYTFAIVTRSLFQAKKVDEALQVWAEMTEMGVKPDARGYSSFLIGLCDCRKYDLAYVILQEINREKVPVEAMAYNMVMDGLCKEMRLDEAEKLLENKARQGSNPDVYGYSYLIQSYCKMGNLIKAVDHYEAMVSHGIETNCHINGDMDKAHLWFHDMVQRGLSIDVIVYTILMNGYCKAGRLQEACQLFVQMTNLGIKPDVIAYTVLLDGHLKETLQQGWEGIAKERRSFLLRANHNKLLSSMKDMQIEPDVPCYTVLIDGKCKAEYLVEARELFDEMLQKGLTPDAYAYTALINGYCSQGEISKAEDLLQEMIDKGIEPDELTFSVLNQSSLRSRKIQFCA